MILYNLYSMNTGKAYKYTVYVDIHIYILVQNLTVIRLTQDEDDNWGKVVCSIWQSWARAGHPRFFRAFELASAKLKSAFCL
jgi:hypothetical protein